MLPVQSAIAAPEADPASPLRAQQPDQPLIAFLRQGNLWLMNGDGSGQRQVTDYADPVQDFSWSPSGRYLLIQHGGRYREQGNLVESDAVTDLHDVATGETWEIARASEPNWMIASANPPVWATDADELIQVAFDTSDGRTYRLTHLALDGTPTPLGSFEERYICGGPDGPFTTMWQLQMEQHGGGWNRNTYEPVIWSRADQMAWVRPFCGQAWTVDLATDSAAPFPYRPLTGIGANLLVGGDGASWSRPSLYDPATGDLQPLFEGDVFAAGPDGAIYFTRIVQGASSAFVSRFDDFPTGITDNTVELWRTDLEASGPVLVASIPVFGAGVPRVTGDGSAVVLGTVDNPTDLIDVDESGADWYTPELYADHLKTVRVDVATGEATVLTGHAILPKPQPAGVVVAESPAPVDEQPIDLTGTPEPTVAPTEAAQQPVSAADDGWIAYAGRDGNIWLSRPDGSDQRQVTTDGSPDRPYIHPNWSPDGTMLVFSTRNGQEETGNDIYLLRDGAVTRVPSIHNCSSAAFMAAGARLALLCASGPRRGTPSQDSLDIDPSRGFVSVVDLDGANWRVLTPFELERNGSNTLSWDKLATYDIDVSPVDGEILVNSIFFSSARSRGISLISREGAWDAQFSTPADERGRIWGRFDAEGTNILTRICRGCYKDSPGPPNTAILLLDRDGNVIETLYTPNANVLLDGFVQSPDGSRLLVSSTTEESDFDFGTAGLTYTTQMVDIASGAVADVPIDGGDFAWQPAAVDIAVPESTAGLQPTTQFISTAPVVAIACTTTSEGFLLSAETLNLPEGCAVAEGMRFTVSGANGEPYGQCVIGSAAYCSQPEIWMPVDVEVTVTVDASTIPEGYAVVGGNPQKFTFESTYLNTDAAQWLIVLMPADVAAAQGGAPEATEQATEAAAEPGSASGLVIEPGRDWIAYEGNDGNIWLMQPDGSRQVQVTTDGTADFPYVWPTWSHGGTMLVFSRPDYASSEPTYTYLFRGGVVSRVPNVHACNAAAFMPGDQQLVLGCGFEFPPSGTSDSAMQTDPSLGFVSMANLDGSDWHVHVPYHRASEGVWPNHEGGADLAWAETISTHPDGTIVVNFAGPHGMGMAILASGSTTPTVHRSPLGRGAVTGRFFPGSDEILIGMCGGCYPRSNYSETDFTIAWSDRSGAITTTLYVPDPAQSMGMPTISPDGSTLVFSTNRSIHTLDLNTGAEVEIATGIRVAWQPNASVTMGRPASPVTSGAASPSGSTTTPATAGQPPPAQAATGAVPDQFIATWSGRGVQENPYGEWAVTISITGGGIGEIVGTSEYPEESCGGNLILQEVTADAIVMREQLTYGQETCADGGTITLSGIGGGDCQFAWSGIGPYGTPSSAGGTLSRPDGATGSSAPDGEAASQSGTQGNGPPTVDTSQLHSFFIGTWSGMGDQESPTNTWPITVTFTGGRPGEVVGTSEYPTLGCGGELILDSIDPYDNFLTIYITERITYGQENCTDIGTFVFSGAEGARRLHFSYGGSNVVTTAEAWLDPVELGGASAPAEQTTGASDAQPVETSASGGAPPSIYDDPEAEPVPIEAEGG